MDKNKVFDYNFKEGDESEIERHVGMEVFSTPSIQGTGGVYKHHYRDFIVREIVNEGIILNIKEDDTSAIYSEHYKDKFTTFNLIKKNIDTFKAIREISRALGIPRQTINVSGLKDKRALTVQKVSIKGNHIQTLRNLKITNLNFRNIISTKKPVKLGSNLGNFFRIIVRKVEDLRGLDKRIKEINNQLNNLGFPNYFGLQRFGVFRPNSHVVGRYLLERKFKEAFEEMVLKTYSSESPTSAMVRKNLGESGDYERAYEEFPKGLNYERYLIKHLIERPNDYEGAFRKFFNELKNLLFNAFQSYIFNKMISLRVKKGYSLLEPVDGDVISILDEENGYNTHIKYVYKAGKGLYDKYLVKAMKLNRAVMIAPLVGKNTNLNDFPFMRSLFEEIIEEEGISIDVFKNQQELGEKEFNGSVRTLIAKPVDLRIELKDDDIFQGKKKIILEFSLKKGTYATSLLRELMK